MHICLITPAARQSRSGNRTTAYRWQRILKTLGYKVSVSQSYDGSPADLMIALHAWRSAAAAADFRSRFPDRPLIVALGGTDIYQFQYTQPDTTLWTMELADRLVALHDLAGYDIPAKFGEKLRIIHQSAAPLPQGRAPSKRSFDVVVAGHLRGEKDPLRAAYAAAHAPAASKLRILHYGKARDDRWAATARAEMNGNPRYHWRDEVSNWQVRRALSRCHALVISSVMEGGANIVSEAIVAGVPILASDISGNVGLLGADYEGYFSVEDTAGLADLLRRAEEDKAFLLRLAQQCAARVHLFTPAAETSRWNELLMELSGG